MMNYKARIDVRCAKFAFDCHCLQAQELLDLYALRVIFFALFNCHLSYCIEYLGWMDNAYLDPAYHIQKWAFHKRYFEKRLSFSSVRISVITTFYQKCYSWKF